MYFWKSLHFLSFISLLAHASLKVEFTQPFPFKRESKISQEVTGWIHSLAPSSELKFSAYSMSNRAVLRSVCVALKKNIHVSFYLHVSNVSETKSLLAQICNLSPDAIIPNPSFFAYGRNRDINLHHAKFIISKDPKGNARLAFTSANFGRGLYGHYENWAFTRGHAESKLFQSHFCFLKVIESPSDLSNLKGSFAQCRVLGKADSVENQKIIPFFIPFDKSSLEEKISSLFQRSQHVDIQTQYLSSEYILKLIETYPEPQKLRILADGDVVKLRQGKKSLSRYWDMWMLSRLHLRSFNLRFIGNSSELDTLQHNKSLLFQNKNSASVLTGSGNFSNAGLGDSSHPNTENFYLIEDEKVFQLYSSNFKKLWKLSHTIEEIQNE